MLARPLGLPTPKEFIALDAGSVYDTADSARTAALEFLEGSHGAWTARDLISWLGGPYRNALVDAPRCGTIDLPSADVVGSLEWLLVRARRQVIDSLEDRVAWASAAFFDDASTSSLVVGVHDAHGSIGFAPAYRPTATLADRVLALLLADYLMRPSDYDALSICDDCGHLSFGWSPVHTADCGNPAARATSGFIVK
jgi:hypothetical protein